MKLLPGLGLLCFCTFSAVSHGGVVGVLQPDRPDTASTDKWRYHLFNPVPREQMRELSADRPDATESPYTVDAGHFQVETSFAAYGRDDREGVKTEAWTFGAFNLKAGLLNNVDIQFVFDTHTRERTTVAGAETGTVEGFSDLQVRLKVNLWGNDGGRTGLAFFPFVKIPTGSELSNDKVEGGVILPFAVAISDRVGLGLQAEVDFVYDEDSGGYDAEFLHTAVLGFDVTDRLGAYVEYLGVAGSRGATGYQASFSGGLTFALNDDTVLDAGAVVGLNDAAEDLAVFTGMTVRF